MREPSPSPPPDEEESAAQKYRREELLVSSTIGRRTGVLPRWFVAIGIVAAVVMLLSVGIFEPLALIFPAWVAILSLILLRTRPETWHIA
jgi:hypothetical protein